VTHQVWGYGLRTADLRSRPANISVAVRRSAPLRRGPGQPQPGHRLALQHNREQQELLTGGSLPDGAVPYQKVKRVGHGLRKFTNYRPRLLLHCGVRWQTHQTADCVAAHHVSWHRAGSCSREKSYSEATCNRDMLFIWQVGSQTDFRSNN
jgi:hypothetical protein